MKINVLIFNLISFKSFANEEKYYYKEKLIIETYRLQ